MKTWYREKPAWLAAGLWVIFLVLMALLLLPALVRGQSAWPAGDPPTSLQGASQVGPGNLSPPELRSPAPGWENPARQPARTQLATLPASEIHQNLTVKPAALGRSPWRCPLPPASAFHRQTNLRLYLETWPTPGSTVAAAWPEYVAEDGEDVD